MMANRPPDLESVHLNATGVRSLVFQGESLVDWVGGGRVLRLDGTEQRSRVFYAYRFDSAVLCPSGRYSVLFERLGTKGAVIDATTGHVLREINRSYYHANVYAFPVALWVSPSGHTLLAHCPDEYNRIEIDDIDSGERLTPDTDREPGDYFHSRLVVSPGGTRLLSAGWVWHPWDFVGWFDLDRALRDPKHLDKPQVAEGSVAIGLAEEASAAWQTDDCLLVGSSDEPEDPEEVAAFGGAPRLVSPGLAVVDVRAGSVVQSVSLPHPPGAMMPVGTHEVVTFFEHPRLYRLSDGLLLHEWPHLPTGTLTSSIEHHLEPPPPTAIDAARVRFAVATADAVEVVDLSSRVRA